ncbi:unnamed protein product, partial [Mesorhabditis belari]|uniref:Dol-P-Glc:Glc(2)Man(9)GlcNAc(2)-PP-Dol alpha-1,2-glucosyltransferase n=1 Tax=Mesorhabditis belari TaxID=2138241 RepID=A0AAF3EDE0_9BILA
MLTQLQEKTDKSTGINKEWTIALALGTIHALMVAVVNKIVPNPYMDEIFHIRQTRRYCDGDYTWDPMITTPPLLYIISMPLCGGHERYINSILLPFTFIGACRFRAMFTGEGETVLVPALSVVLLPVLFHSSLLFYTDLLSLTLVLWAFSSTNKYIVAFFFGLSLFCRQTNIVWAGLFAALDLCKNIKKEQLVKSLLKGCLDLWPFILLAGGFLAFVVKNGGIVLGDPDAHRPQFHCCQLLYFCVFACFTASFSLLEYAKPILQSFFQWRTVLFTAAIALIVHHFSLAHPYLLADNRHVPFYLWRWILSKPIYRQLLIPVYVVCFYAVDQLCKGVTPIARLFFALATIAVLLPAHLIEPRYFIIPYVLWRLSAETRSRLLCTLEALFQICVFAPLFYMFLYKPFEWSHEPGDLQRFMW